MKYLVNDGMVLSQIPKGMVCNVGDDSTIEVDIEEDLDLDNFSFFYIDGILSQVTKQPSRRHIYIDGAWVQLETVRPYGDNRAAEYPPISDQLDMLYHAMDAGEIPKATAWYDTIKAIKIKYPKG